ncbi:tyrosine-type recombinase/integrase [Klebsiella pneumoniae]|uniref:tyrosine-type recombinase/integrase n=1 Tax=Klebsiella pneumoniae TaxID=573 RepID=UPI0007F0F4BC|nr:tyrosine-type recombinase/integrase [Klebsiella pneumoniae]ANI75705.1 Resolvase [Klebsiella pneumoniae]
MNTFPLQISQNSRSDAIGTGRVTYAYFDYADALALREMASLVPLTDPQYVRKVREFLTTLRIGKQQLLWPVQSDNTPRNWIRKALDLAKRDSVTFSIPVTCHTFRHSFCMHLIQHGVPLKVVQAYAGHSRLETTETYTRVFALDVGRQYGVRFSLPDSHLTLPE